MGSFFKKFRAIEAVKIEVIYKQFNQQIEAGITWKNDVILSATALLELYRQYPEFLQLFLDTPDLLQPDLAPIKDLKVNLVTKDGKTELIFVEIFKSKMVEDALKVCLSEGLRVAYPQLPFNNHIMESFLVFKSTQKSTQNFISKFKIDLRKYFPDTKLNKLKIVASPFGQRFLQGTTYYANGSNVINKTLFLLDKPLPGGSEGSMVRTLSKYIFGVVLGTHFSKFGATIATPLLVSLGSVLVEYYRLKDISQEFVEIHKLLRDFVVFIESGTNSVGSGCLVAIGKSKYIITCAHVIEDPEKITIRWRGQSYEPEFIYKNPVPNQAFDLAILKAPSNIPITNFCKISDTVPKIGTKVVSVGYPSLFSKKLIEKGFLNSSIFEGQIINTKPEMLITNLLVHAGQSGAPIFDSNKEVVGIIVSNIIGNGEEFPTLNFAIPTAHIHKILKEYDSSKKINALNQLVRKKQIQKVWNLEEPIIKAKL